MRFIDDARWRHARTRLHRTFSRALMAAIASLVTGLLSAPMPTLAQAPAEPTPPPGAAPPPARPLLYMFEHYALRESAFRYDQDMQALIANPRQAGQPIARMFAKAMFRAARMPNFETDAAADQVREFMPQITFETVRRGGYTIHVMGMPPPEHPTEAYFIAIVYKDDEPLIEDQPAPSTRYIVFEHTTVDDHVFAVGTWDANGQHETLGFGDSVPTINNFIASVLSMIGIEGPSVGRVSDLAVMRWLNAYGAAWQARNAEQAAALFSEDATYQETPYADAFVGQAAIAEYWSGVTADQSDIAFEAEILAISGLTAVARWSSRFRSISADAPVELNGVFVLDFEADGRVSALREWWHVR